MAKFIQGGECPCLNFVTYRTDCNPHPNFASGRTRAKRSATSGHHFYLPTPRFEIRFTHLDYTEFEQRAGQIKSPRGAKTDLVVAAIEAQTGAFRVSDIQHACPGVSLDMIRQVLKNLRGNKVECLGRGQNAQWQKLGN
jgi:hypothetical protein